MDGLYLLGFGPRTAAAARDLAQKLYPDLQAPQKVGYGTDSGAGRLRPMSVADIAHRGLGRLRHSPPARRTLVIVLAVLLLVVMTLAATIGAAGIPVRRLPAALGLWPADGDSAFLARDRLVLWSIRLPRIAMAAIVGALLAACWHNHAGIVPQSAGRSGARRRCWRRRTGCGLRHRHRRPVARGQRHASAILAAAGCRLRWLAAGDNAALSDRYAREPHLHCGVPARRAGDRGAVECRYRHARLHRRRPSAARRDFLDARLDQRRDLEQSCDPRAVPVRDAGAGAEHRPRARSSGAWARAKRSTWASRSSA